MSQVIPTFESTSTFFQKMARANNRRMTEDVLKYLWAWWVSRQTQPSKEEVRDLFSFFLGELKTGQDTIALVDVQETDIFNLGEFDDDEESEVYATTFQANLRTIGVL
jgi:hypothetical protein